MKTDTRLLKWQLEKYYKEKRVPVWFFGQNSNIEYTNFVTSALLNLMERMQSISKSFTLAHSIEGSYFDDTNPHELYYVFTYEPGKHSYTVIIGPVLTSRPTDRVWDELSFSKNIFSEQKQVLFHSLSVLRKEDFFLEVTSILSDIFELPTPDFTEEIEKEQKKKEDEKKQNSDIVLLSGIGTNLDTSDIDITYYKEIVRLKELYRFYIQNGNTYQLYAYFNNERNIDILYPNKANLQDCQFKTVELLTIAAQASVENGHGKKSCFMMYHSSMEKLKNARSFEKILELLKEAAISLARSTRDINAYTSKDYSPTTNKCIQRIVEKMPDKILLDDLATELHISPKYLSALFNKETGTSITDFIQDIRINEAKNLLLSSDLTYLEISNMLNFSSQSYFNAIFKKKTGSTPKEFRTRADNRKEQGN